MSLPNQVVYIQFHPVAYMVKLNIEMSMADLITRLARGENNDAYLPSTSHNQTNVRRDDEQHVAPNISMHSMHSPKAQAQDSSEEESDIGSARPAAHHPRNFNAGIHVETIITSQSSRSSRAERERTTARKRAVVEDELPLAHGSDGISSVQY